MNQSYPGTSQPRVAYFYLPSLHEKSAEIIQVLNCDSVCIYIPVPEEDLELASFFQRTMTPAEIRQFGNTVTWRIFTCWHQLENDHRDYEVKPPVIAKLLKNKASKPLMEKYTAVA